MDEQFDNNLKNHIREVFENFEDTSADEGWLLLRKKFPEKEKDRGIFWLWFGSAAAILLILLGIGTWVNFQKNEPEKLSYKHKPVKANNYENKIAKQEHEATNQTNLSNTGTIGKAIAVNIPAKKHSALIAKIPVPIKSVGKDSVSKSVKNNFIVQNSPVNKIRDNPTVSAGGNIINSTMSSHDTVAKKNVVAITPKPVPPAVIGSKEDKLRFTQTIKKESEQEKVRFSVYAATYFNYAKGSSNQLNIGAGATADIRITENIKLSTGMSIAQNTLNYTNYPQSISIADFRQSIPLASQFASSNSGLYNVAYASTLTVKNYNAQLIGLDVPVNLKYEFNPQRNNDYFAVGLSSGTFINESYTYQYNYNAIAPQSQTTNNSFSNFYFAKTLNVSFGVGYPLGKNHIVIEPFLKYPLQGLGEQQLHFGAGGINLKFDLQPSKK